jgi:hypothetical protein
LLREDVFHSDPSEDHQIVMGLRATRIRLVAGAKCAASQGGRTALVTLYAQLAMLGFGIDLDIPEAALVAPQPPLEGDRLVAGLEAYGRQLWGSTPAGSGGTPQLTIAVGGKAAGADITVSWATDAAFVFPAAAELPPPAATGLPFSPLGAAAAAAASGARAAIPIVAEHLGIPLPTAPRWLDPVGRRISLALSRLVGPIDPDLGWCDAISGGAITSAALYVLLRVPGLSGRLRIIEDDILEASNLNRYALALRRHLGWEKAAALAEWSTETFTVEPSALRLTAETAVQLRPFAPIVLAGVDDIAARWLAQGASGSGRLYVGATSHDYVLVSEHVPGGACAGCVHPRNDPAVDEIPTIGFVSLWAGLAQAAFVLGRSPSLSGRAADVAPLGLEGRRGLRPYIPLPHPRCPLACSASTRLAG